MPRYDLKDLRMTLIAPWADESVRLREFEVPKWFDVKLQHPEWSASAVLSVVIDPESGPVAAGLRADREATDASYRDVAAMLAATAPMETLLQIAAVTAIGLTTIERARGQLLSDVTYERLELMLGTSASARAVLAKAHDAARPQRRRTVTKDLLRQVAEVYRTALAAGDPPTAAVAEHFTRSHSTAARWVGMARTAGELGPAPGRQAGEAIDEGGGEADGGPDQEG